MQGECNGKTGKLSFTGLDIAEPKLILYKDNANERQKSLLLFVRVQLILYKDKKRAAQRQMNAEVFSEHGMNRISSKYATKTESTDTKQRGLRERK